MDSFLLLSSTNFPKAGVPEGPEMGPGTPRWLECVSECAVSDGEEWRDVVRMKRGKMGVVRCAEVDVWDERVAEQGLCEGLQEKGVGWWEEVLVRGGRVSGGLAAMLAFLWWTQVCDEVKESGSVGRWLERAGRSSEMEWEELVRLEEQEWRLSGGTEGLREVSWTEDAEGMESCGLFVRWLEEAGCSSRREWAELVRLEEIEWRAERGVEALKEVRWLDRCGGF